MMGRKPDEKIRRPMQWSGDDFGGFSTTTPWEVLDPSYTDLNFQSQIEDPASLLSTYRNLIAIRAAHPALTLGDYVPVEATNRGVYAFLRQKGSETLLVVVNLTKGGITDMRLRLRVLILPMRNYRRRLVSG